jgi:predicted fused transcriptional regulator/phosphomethylpyrimidine kinase
MGNIARTNLKKKKKKKEKNKKLAKLIPEIQANLLSSGSRLIVIR